MARYKPYSYTQGQFIPVFFSKQIQEGTFEYLLSSLVENELDQSIYDRRFNNDDAGSPAYDLSLLLIVVLFTYPRGISSSSAIARYCGKNVFFTVLRMLCDLLIRFFAGIGDQRGFSAVKNRLFFRVVMCGNNGFYACSRLNSVVVEGRGYVHQRPIWARLGCCD